MRGQALFAADVQLPGLRYGRVLRAPASPEFNSRLARANESAARAVPGFVAIVHNPLPRLANAEGLGIVARAPGALNRIAQALDAQWTVDGPPHPFAWQVALDSDRALEERTTGPCGSVGDHWPRVLRLAFAVLVDRLTAPPTLVELARQMNMSPRSLQRQFQQEGLGFRQLLAEARDRTAGPWLLHGLLPLAEVGFLSGYADQSHFTREIRQRSGLTPAAYRTNFRIPI